MTAFAIASTDPDINILVLADVIEEKVSNRFPPRIYVLCCINDMFTRTNENTKTALYPVPESRL